MYTEFWEILQIVENKKSLMPPGAVCVNRVQLNEIRRRYSLEITGASDLLVDLDTKTFCLQLVIYVYIYTFSELTL